MQGLDLSRRQVMAIVNVTDDSFYAGSRVVDAVAVARRVEEAVEQGCTIVDIGGYSSRPGACDIPVEEEWRRVQLGLHAAREVSADVAISVDTFRAEVVRRCFEEVGDIVVNDISAGALDAQMVPTVARLGLNYVAMHMRGTPQTMQGCTHYDSVVDDVCGELSARTNCLIAEGVDAGRIILDPGFGFAKSAEQNFELLGGLSKVVSLGFPVLVGLSRKSMIYRTLGITPEESLCGTQVLMWEALRQGATILRVHDVREAQQTIKLYETMLGL